MAGSVRFAVESWSPEYGSPFENGDEGETPPAVDLRVEVPPEHWAPIDPRGSAARSVAFVDGVRRIDARIWASNGEGGVTGGICASYAAGVVRCDGAARVERPCVERGLFGPRVEDGIPTRAGLYLPFRTADDKFQHLSNELQNRLGALEIQVAAAVSAADLVVVDGPLSHRENVPGAIGFVKTHHVTYLPDMERQILARLLPGQRTPVFLTQTTWSRYSWYLRLPGGSGHPWAGIVRCEAASTLSREEAVARADAPSATLPAFASAPHKDSRAPQNLYPIAGLERDLRHRLGDATLVYRLLRSATARLPS
jgi:hypothetical protein